LPEPFQRPFGVEQLCTPSFAARWREVGEEQKVLLNELSQLVRPIDVIRYLGKTAGGSWLALATEYESLHKRLEGLKVEIEALRKERIEAIHEYRALKQKRVSAERAKGDHFRAFIFEKDPKPEDIAERERLTQRVEEAIAQIDAAKRSIAKLLQAQSSLAQAPEVLAVHERRRSIELEAELKRLSLIREAVINSDGLNHANHRPSAWWFPLVCPGGKWFRQTIESAEYYLEHITA
jgi:chromosome segregation ATPase